MTEVVKVEPNYFQTDAIDTLTRLIEKKLCNKVVNGVGLCICVYEIDEIYPSQNIPGEGSAYTKTDFRCIMFKPYVGEILIGKVKYCCRSYVKVTLEFFDDVLIFIDQLPKPITFNSEDNIFKWQFSDECESTSDAKGFFVCPLQDIRFRVRDVLFDYDVVTSVEVEGKREEEKEREDIKTYELLKKRKTMVVIGSISEMGLGPIDWWKEERE